MANTLAPFEGKDVLQVGIELPGAAGGLRESLRVDPQEFHQGDKVYVVHETTCAKVRFEPIDKADPSGPQRRVHVLGVTTATIVDADLVAQQLDAQRRRIEDAKGLQRLPGSEAEVRAFQLAQAHAAGEHAAELVDGCEVCQAEKDAAAAEAPPAPTSIKGRRKRAGASQ